MAGPIFPDITVNLTGEDGNAFFLVARVRSAIERAGHRKEAQEFFDKALSGDYYGVIKTAQEYVNIT